MKITSINYSESREYSNEIGLKNWKKIGMEAELDETDKPEQCIEELKQRVSAQFATQLHPVVEQPKVEVNTEEQRIEALCKTIGYCSSLKLLKNFTKSVQREEEKYPQVRVAYELKYEQLSKKEGAL